VCVACDDWYQRSRRDDEGDFFRKVAAQGPRASNGPDGTRQAVYCFTADGTLLGSTIAHASKEGIEIHIQMLRGSLAKFHLLPDGSKAPGAVRVEEGGKPDPNYTRTPPEGGLVARVWTRILERKDGKWARGVTNVPGHDLAARDHLWLTADEVQSLVPSRPAVGKSYAVPDPVADRLLRYHLVDNTRGEPSFWWPEHVRRCDLRLKVTAASAESVELRLDGEALLTAAASGKQPEHGYEARMQGRLRYRPSSRAFDRFDLAVVGDYWGEGPYTKGSRPGKNPLGVVIELAGDEPTDRIPPQGAREQNKYFGRKRPATGDPKRKETP
jgi:hypothetical protein